MQEHQSLQIIIKFKTILRAESSFSNDWLEIQQASEPEIKIMNLKATKGTIKIIMILDLTSHLISLKKIYTNVSSIKAQYNI